MAARRGLVERAGVAAHGLERERAGEIGQPREPQRLLGHERARADRDAVGAHEREPFLGLRDDRRQARPRQRDGRRQQLAVELGLALADHDARDRGHVHEIARAHRAGARHDRVHAGVEHRHEQPHGLEREPRAAARGAADAGEHRGAHVLGVERRADAARVRLDHLALVALQDVERHAVVAHVAEAGVEPVDQPIAGDGAVDDRAAREDRRLDLGRELDPRELARGAHDVRRRDAAGADDDGVGHEAPAWATSSMPSSRSGSR